MNSSPVLLRIVRQVTRSPTHRTSLGCSDTRTDSSTLQCVAITAMRCSIIAFCISIFRATVSSRCSTNIRASRMYMCTVPRSRCACALSCACLNSTSSRMSRFRSSAIRLFIGQMQAHHPPHLGAMAISRTALRGGPARLGKCRYARAARGAHGPARKLNRGALNATLAKDTLGRWHMKKAEVGSRRRRNRRKGSIGHGTRVWGAWHHVPTPFAHFELPSRRITRERSSGSRNPQLAGRNLLCQGAEKRLRSQTDKRSVTKNRSSAISQPPRGLTVLGLGGG